jgi:hypothetical protein
VRLGGQKLPSTELDRTARPVFALANPYRRWELDDPAQRLDEQPAAELLREGLAPAPAPASSDSGLTADGRRPVARCLGGDVASAAGPRPAAAPGRPSSGEKPPDAI